MANYGYLQFAENIMVARRSEMSADWKVRQLVQSIYSTESKIFFENGMIPKLLRQYWIFLTFHYIKETE
jgi:hypothetical protein